MYLNNKKNEICQFFAILIEPIKYSLIKKDL